MSDHSLKVTILKFGQVFLEGNFDVSDADRRIVTSLLKEITLTREGAEDLLLGYMHARDVDQVSEDLGKMAMAATVFILNEGDAEIVINADEKK